MIRVATAKIVDPASVQAKLNPIGSIADDGAIFVSIDEEGFDNANNYVYCRYGLPIPYYKVQENDKLLVVPTKGLTERWFYIGLADVGNQGLPTEQGVLGNELRTYITALITEINDELKTKFNNHITEYNLHTHSGVTTGPGASGPPAATSTINSAGVTDATDVILSDVIYLIK